MHGLIVPWVDTLPDHVNVCININVNKFVSQTLATEFLDSYA